MLGATEQLLERSTKRQLTDALLSACQELAYDHEGHDMPFDNERGYVNAGSLNNQVLFHLLHPQVIIEG